MNRVFESSIVVQALRWLARESVVARAAGAMARRLRRLDDAFARAAADKAVRPDSDQVEAIVAHSGLLRAIDRAFSAPVSAWEHSKVRPFLESVHEMVEGMALPERIRLLGWMLAVAVISRAVLYVASGATVTAATAAVWTVVLATAAFMAMAAQPIAVAWREWKRRKG